MMLQDSFRLGLNVAYGHFVILFGFFAVYVDIHFSVRAFFCLYFRSGRPLQLALVRLAYVLER